MQGANQNNRSMKLFLQTNAPQRNPSEGVKMRKLITSGAAAIAFGIASLAMSTMSQATITVVASYELGDSDPGAVSGNVGNATTVDSSGNGFNLTSRIGSPTYSSDRTPGSGYVSMSFDGSSFYSGPTVTNNTENFGISLFVKP